MNTYVNSRSTETDPFPDHVSNCPNSLLCLIIYSSYRFPYREQWSNLLFRQQLGEHQSWKAFKACRKWKLMNVTKYITNGIYLRVCLKFTVWPDRFDLQQDCKDTSKYKPGYRSSAIFQKALSFLGTIATLKFQKRDAKLEACRLLSFDTPGVCSCTTWQHRVNRLILSIWWNNNNVNPWKTTLLCEMIRKGKYIPLE